MLQLLAVPVSVVSLFVDILCAYGTLFKLISGKVSAFANILQDLLRGDAVLSPHVPHHDWREDIPRSKVGISFFKFK
jgi:hypothetical protein